MRKACAFVTAINKLPLIVKSCPGFLVNRVLAPYMMEAVRRYQMGEPREKIDQAALKFGMPMGPLELMDMVGLDIANHVGEELRSRARTATMCSTTLVKQGKLGKKTGEGFYVWEQGKPKREDGHLRPGRARAPRPRAGEADARRGRARARRSAWWRTPITSMPA